MTVVLYDLCGAEGRRFSPYCWRARMALAHKGLDVEVRPTRFTEIASICDGERKTLPTIEDHGRTITDSWEIARYLEEAYPDRPSLFGDAAVGTTFFVQSWANTVLHPGLIGLVLHDIWENLCEPDRDYFRESREKRFGRTLEAVQEGREDRVEAFRASLTPLRTTLAAQPFVAGAAPAYADYIVFGAFQWVRVMSPFRVLADDDPIRAWFQRCLDLHGGVARDVPTFY